MHSACWLNAHISESPGTKKPPHRWPVKRNPAQGRHGLVDEAELAQRFCFPGVLSILTMASVRTGAEVTLGCVSLLDTCCFTS